MRAWSLVGLLLLSAHVQAQTLRLAPEDGGVAGQVSIASGIERAVAPLTLSGALGVSVNGRPLALALALTMPLAAPGFDDLRAHLSAAVDLGPREGLLVRLTPGVTLLSTRNDAFEGVALATEVAGLLGWCTPRWAVGAELVGSLTVVTSLTTTDYARGVGQVPAPTAVRWASAVGLQAGVRAALLLGPVELSLRAGYDRKGRYNLAFPPLYVTLSAGLRFQ